MYYFNEQVDFKVSSKLIQASKDNKRWLKWLLAYKTEYIYIYTQHFVGLFKDTLKSNFSLPFSLMYHTMILFSHGTVQGNTETCITSTI